MEPSKGVLRVAEWLYRNAFPVYRPLYRGYRAVVDRKERAALRSHLSPGDVAVDVGANIGSYTTFLADVVGPTGRVVAFEPAEENLENLVRVCGRLGQVEVVQAAVGNATGELTLYRSDVMNVDHQTYDSGEGRSAVKVPSYRLDDFFPAGTKVDLIKMDIQGFEYQALQGMRRLLEESPNIAVLMEYWPYGLMKAGTDPAEAIGFLESLGFKLTFFGDLENADGLPAIGSGLSDYTNLLATR
jgi:FkbM family methyltransferase